MKLRIFDIKESAQWQKSDFDPSISSTGRIEASVLKRGGQSTINARFTEKPWVEDFSNFLNRLPHKQYIVARSTESCLTPGEADQQAINDACSHVGPLLTNLQDPIKLSPNDILESGMIVDRFVQSFEGTAGKIWRQALLLDVSNQKINQLALNIANISRARRNHLARTIFSVAGLLGLITVVYGFLNAATKGYYSWSLRIAGVVLAVILIFLLLA